ncbi:MAG: aminomethyl-transferring glycine dehydrogenase subunit GcvPA [Acidimicrobiales bacterium]
MERPDMGHYVPHTDAEVAAMLAELGLADLDELFEMVPAALRLAGGLDLSPGLAEADVVAELDRLAALNRSGRDLVCFAGGGAYDHDIASVTRHLASRSEFVTSYTPYQPEVAQGVLQALFEYQTVVARLAGLPIANASLYDGATAAVEAVNLAVAATGRCTVWVSGGLPPHWREVLETLAKGPGHRLVTSPLRDGLTDWAAAGQDDDPPAALLVASPNYLGALEDLRAARAVADQHGALLIGAFDPVRVSLIRSPGACGADVAVGEGQPLGTPLSFGGPYLGLFACRGELVRRIPGRLVGRTVDTEGRAAYVTTLRAREQDIRRQKALSNICTNQTLIAVAFLVQLSWLGPSGLAEVATRSARAARYAREALLAIEGVTPLASAPTLGEFALRLPASPHAVVERMADAGFLAGLPVGLEGGAVTDGDDGLLVAVTEKRTRSEIDCFVATLEKVLP